MVLGDVVEEFVSVGHEELRARGDDGARDIRLLQQHKPDVHFPGALTTAQLEGEGQEGLR